VEIASNSFTKLLQIHSYNVLHTSAARPEPLQYEHLSLFAGSDGVVGPTSFIHLLTR
jgi:hypothetical protein